MTDGDGQTSEDESTEDHMRTESLITTLIVSFSFSGFAHYTTVCHMIICTQAWSSNSVKAFVCHCITLVIFTLEVEQASSTVVPFVSLERWIQFLDDASSLDPFSGGTRELPVQVSELEKWRSGESEDDDVMKKAKSSSSGQVRVEETVKLLRKIDREERKRKREREGDQDDGRF